MALAAQNWGSTDLENKDREGPLELGTWAGGGSVWYYVLGSPLTLGVEVMAEFYASLNAGGFMM